MYIYIYIYKKKKKFSRKILTGKLVPNTKFNSFMTKNSIPPQAPQAPSLWVVIGNKDPYDESI